MNIVIYEPSLFDEVLSASPDLPSRSTLRHRSFVDYYFGSSDHCRLSLVLGERNRLLAMQGVEQLPIEDQGTRLRLGCGCAFYSFRPGMGAYLVARWLRSCDAGLAFAVNDPMRQLIDRMHWSNYTDIRTYCVNPVYAESWGHPLRRLGKMALEWLTPRRSLALLPGRLPGDLADVAIREETEYPYDLLGFQSGFRFRLAADLGYLRWRYCLSLPFARYRLFRIAPGGRGRGYVILQDGPAGILVSHSDGNDPRLLAAATIRSLGAVARGPGDRRQVTLVSLHPVMQQVFETVGFRHMPRRQKGFALGTLKGAFPIATPMSGWLVNVDWGDRGLRRPFLDEISSEAPPQSQSAV